MGDKFEEIERQQLGKVGYEDALREASKRSGSPTSRNSPPRRRPRHEFARK